MRTCIIWSERRLSSSLRSLSSCPTAFSSAQRCSRILLSSASRRFSSYLSRILMRCSSSLRDCSCIRDNLKAVIISESSSCFLVLRDHAFFGRGGGEKDLSCLSLTDKLGIDLDLCGVDCSHHCRLIHVTRICYCSAGVERSIQCLIDVIKVVVFDLITVPQISPLCHSLTDFFAQRTSGGIVGSPVGALFRQIAENFLLKEATFRSCPGYRFSYRRAACSHSSLPRGRCSSRISRKRST